MFELMNYYKWYNQKIKSIFKQITGLDKKTN